MFEYILAGLLFLFGVVSATRSLTEPVTDDQASIRLLIAIHQAAKALFWFSLAGFFLAYRLTEGAPEVKWLVLVPVAMAGLRLLTASRLSRA
jgi:hypothetical protein